MNRALLLTLLLCSPLHAETIEREAAVKAIEALPAVVAPEPPEPTPTDSLYHPDSPWLADASDWPKHPNSDKDLKTWLRLSDRIGNDWSMYSYRVHDAGAVRHKVQIEGLWSTVGPDGYAMRSDRNRYWPWLPIPDDLAPSPGSDGSAIILDWETKTEYGLWKAERAGSRWKARNGYALPFGCMPPQVMEPGTSGTDAFISRGMGGGYLAGGLSFETLASGNIPHALALASPACGPGFEHPAIRSDGVIPGGINQGSRWLLDKDFPLDNLPWELQVVGRCLKKHGWIFVDKIDLGNRPQIHSKAILLDSPNWAGIFTKDAFRVFPIERHYRVQQQYPPVVERTSFTPERREEMGSSEEDEGTTVFHTDLGNVRAGVINAHLLEGPRDNAR